MTFSWKVRASWLGTSIGSITRQSGEKQVPSRFMQSLARNDQRCKGMDVYDATLSSGSVISVSEDLWNIISPCALSYETRNVPELDGVYL